MKSALTPQCLLVQSLLFVPTVIAVSVGTLIGLWFYLPAGGLFSAVASQLGLPRLECRIDRAVRGADLVAV